MTALVTVQFQNQPIVVIENDGQFFVSMKHIVENIGLVWQGQFERIKRHAILKSSIRVIRMVAEDGKNREMLCLPLNMLNGWLFGVDVNRVKPAIKEKLTTYQRECFDVLDAHFNKKPQPTQPADTDDWHFPVHVVERAADMAGQVFASAIKQAAITNSQLERWIIKADYFTGTAAMQQIERDAYVLPMSKLPSAIKTEASIPETLAILNACAHRLNQR